MIGNDKHPENPHFDPPYSLRGQVGLLFCLSPDATWFKGRIGSSAPDLRLVKLVNRVPVVVVCSHWEPHPEHPEPYDEVIVSCFAFNGLKIYSVPVVLHLNDDFHVRLGREHYHLPKILTPSLRTLREHDGFAVISEDIRIRLKFMPATVQLLLFPVSFVCALIIAAGTNIVKIAGIGSRPVIKSRISLVPGISLGRFARSGGIDAGVPAKLNPVLNLFWRKTHTVIGVPKQF